MLNKMAKTGTFTVYISGPMSGIKDFNRPIFDEAAAMLREKGFTVIVPHEGEIVELSETATWTLSRAKRQMYLSRDIDYIQEMADAVIVLPGWENSEGAKIEVAVAQTIGVPVFVFQEGGTLLRRKVVLTVE